MKISVIVQSRLWGFDMAKFFEQRGVLNELVTSYAGPRVHKMGVSARFIKRLYIHDIINKATFIIFKAYPLGFLALEAFDFLASYTIKYDSDFYFIWSGAGLRTIKRIRKKNKAAKIILVRGSAHIKTQDDLLKSITPNGKSIINKHIIKKELAEYDAADFITIPSTFAYNTFIDSGIPANKLFLNYLGVDLSAFPPKKSNSLSDGLTIGNVGSISSRKNIKSIINVIEDLNNDGYDIKLILAGVVDHETFDANFLNRHFIDYKGKLPQDKLFEVYAQMDLFVINSVEEGLALVQMQAMSCGLPLISTVNAGGLDLVKDGVNGFTIPILDDNALKEKIVWFYNNRNLLKEMGKKSNMMIKNGFTWDDFGQRNIDFLNKISL